MDTLRLIRSVTSHRNRLNVQFCQLALDAPEPLAIDNQCRGAGITQAVGDLLAAPPAVQRYGDRAKGHGGEEGCWPLWVVPHTDRHPVAAPNAKPRKRLGKPGGLVAHLRKGIGFVSKADVFVVAEARTAR